MVGVEAQSPAPQAAPPAAGAQTATFTGCFQNGKQTRTYELDKAVPMSRTTTTQATGTTGTTTTVTKYGLVPGQNVQFQESTIGHKVEVTGILMPSGQSTSKTESRVEERPSGDVAKETTRTEEAMPMFSVTNIKVLPETCEP